MKFPCGVAVAAAVLLVLGFLLGEVRDTPAQPKALQSNQTSLAKKNSPVATQDGRQTPVSLEQAFYLIRSTLLTLNDANRSGNYTVLRDLAAPDFQERNTAADLAQGFSDLRQRKFDLYGAALLPPQLAAVPAITEKGLLRLTGYVPTQPLQINFDLLFQVVAAQWRLYAIAIATPPNASAQAQARDRPAETTKGARWDAAHLPSGTQ
jgi:hypothetical protein